MKKQLQILHAVPLSYKRIATEHSFTVVSYHEKPVLFGLLPNKIVKTEFLIIKDAYLNLISQWDAFKLNNVDPPQAFIDQMRLLSDQIHTSINEDRQGDSHDPVRAYVFKAIRQRLGVDYPDFIPAKDLAIISIQDLISFLTGISAIPKNICYTF
jgi:hypothetical protein